MNYNQYLIGALAIIFVAFAIFQVYNIRQRRMNQNMQHHDDHACCGSH